MNEWRLFVLKCKGARKTTKIILVWALFKKKNQQKRSNSRQHAVHLRPLLGSFLRVQRLQLFQDRRGVVVVAVLGAFVAGQLPLDVAVGQGVEDRLGVRVRAVHLPAGRGRGGHGKTLQFYSISGRTSVHIVQGLDQNIFGNSWLQQGAEELLLQGCQLGYHFREH